MRELRSRGPQPREPRLPTRTSQRPRPGVDRPQSTVVRLSESSRGRRAKARRRRSPSAARRAHPAWAATKARPSSRQRTFRIAGSPSRSAPASASQSSGRASTSSESPSTDAPRRGRSALVEDVERLVDDPGSQQSEPGIDREDVEAVMGHRAGCDDVDDVFSCAADPAAKPVVDVTRKLGRAALGRAARCRPSRPRPRAGRAGRRCRSRRRSGSDTARRRRTSARARRVPRRRPRRRRTRAASGVSAPQRPSAFGGYA